MFATNINKRHHRLEIAKKIETIRFTGLKHQAKKNKQLSFH